MKFLYTFLFSIVFVLSIYAQSIELGQSTEPTAEMDVQSTDKAVLFPRHTAAQINTISNPAHGLLIFNTTLNSFVYNIGTEATPQWQQIDKLISNTTAEIAAIPTPTAGDIRYNSNTKTIFYYNGNSKLWEEICEDPQCQTLLVSNTVDNNANCYGTNNGGATINATGGTPPYSYVWPDANTNVARTDLSAGSYTVSVTDSKGCNKTTILSISEPTEIILSASKTDITINGGGDGTITVSATGASGIYDYSIDNGATWQGTGTFTSLNSGDYNVMVRDRSTTSCEVAYVSNPVTIYEPGAITVSVVKTDVVCNGSNDGTITITASSSPALTFEYSIDNKVTWVAGNAFTSLTPGSYTVWVRDQALPTNEKEYNANPVVVAEPAKLTTFIASVNADCNGDSNGQIVINAGGGSSSYEYSADNGSTWQASSTIAGLSAGNYNIAVRDANATTCQLVHTGNPVVVAGELLITESLTHILCNTATSGTKNNGTIDIAVTGGNGGNSYSWSDGTGTGTNNADGANQTGLTAGTFSVTVTDSKGCTENEIYTLNQPATISIATTVTDVSCGGTLGSVLLDASGGTPFGGNNYEYSIDNSTWTANVATYTYSNLSVGSYTFYARDNNGCTNSVNATVGGSTGLSISFTNVDNEATCGNADGSVDVVVTGGTAYGDGFDFNWDGLGNDRQVNGHTFNLRAGLHTLEVTDAVGCSNSTTFIVHLDGFTFTDDGTGVAEFSSGNEAYWKFKRCSDPAITALACNCGGTLYYWDDTYDYFVDASNNVLLPTTGGCNTVNVSSFYGHPDEGSFVDGDGDGTIDLSSVSQAFDEIDFSNASISKFQFDATGGSDIFDKDNLIVSPGVLLPNDGSKVIKYFDDLTNTCDGSTNCFATYGTAVAYCPTATNEAEDVANLYSTDCEIGGINIQQTMDGRPTLCTNLYGYGWRVPTIQEMQYSYDLNGGADIKIDPAYFGNLDNDGVYSIKLFSSTKTSSGSGNLMETQLSADGDNNTTATISLGPGFNTNGGTYYVRCVFDSDLPIWTNYTGSCP